MEETLINCSRLEVNCVPNDPVDIKCGGPFFLGFDFDVRVEETEEMRKFIEVALKGFDIPLHSITEGETRALTRDEVWTKEKIAESIAEESEYLLSEATRSYKSFH